MKIVEVKDLSDEKPRRIFSKNNELVSARELKKNGRKGERSSEGNEVAYVSP